MTEGHFCTNCWCDREHRCVCDMCKYTEEELKEIFGVKE